MPDTKYQTLFDADARTRFRLIDDIADIYTVDRAQPERVIPPSQTIGVYQKQTQPKSTNQPINQ